MDAQKRKSKKSMRNYTLSRSDAMLCVRMELATFIYGKSFEALDVADPHFFGIHPGRDDGFNKARYQYIRR